MGNSKLTENVIFVSWDCNQSLYIFSGLDSHGNTIVNFLFCYLTKYERTNYIWCSLPFIDIEFYSTRMTSVSEKLKTVIHSKKVQKRKSFTFEVTFETSIIC